MASLPHRKKPAGISDAAVKAKTGRTWPEWFGILDRWGAHRKAHREIAAYLYAKHGVPGWWAQMVTVGYEHARGLRAVHQSAQGWAASRSKTFHVPLARLYAAWANDRSRRRWLQGAQFVVSMARLDTVIRGFWEGGKSRVDMMFHSRGSNKSQASGDHRRLAGAKDVQKIKAYWGRQLEKLRRILEG